MELHEGRQKARKKVTEAAIRYVRSTVRHLEFRRRFQKGHPVRAGEEAMLARAEEELRNAIVTYSESAGPVNWPAMSDALRAIMLKEAAETEIPQDEWVVLSSEIRLLRIPDMSRPSGLEDTLPRGVLSRSRHPATGRRTAVHCPLH